MAVIRRGRRVGGMRKRRVGRRAGRRAIVRQPLVNRKRYQGIKYFTEVFDAGTLPLSGGWFTCALSSLINHTQYFGLFDLGTITRYDVMLVPLYGDAVQGSSPGTGMITVANTQNLGGTTGFFPPVTSTLALLQESKSRTVPLDGKRIIKFTCWNPKPAVSQTDVQSTPGVFQPATVSTSRQWTWMNLNSGDAQNTLFGGIKYYIDNSTVEPGYKVLIRVYAAFKEQN